MWPGRIVVSLVLKQQAQGHVLGYEVASPCKGAKEGEQQRMQPRLTMQKPRLDWARSARLPCIGEQSMRVGEAYAASDNTPYRRPFHGVALRRHPACAPQGLTECARLRPRRTPTAPPLPGQSPRRPRASGIGRRRGKSRRERQRLRGRRSTEIRGTGAEQQRRLPP